MLLLKGEWASLNIRVLGVPIQATGFHVELRAVARANRNVFEVLTVTVEAIERDS